MAHEAGCVVAHQATHSRAAKRLPTTGTVKRSAFQRAAAAGMRSSVKKSALLCVMPSQKLVEMFQKMGRMRSAL